MILLTKANPTVSKKGLVRDLETAGSFHPQDYGFDIAFGIGQPLDPSFGYYKVQEIVYYYPDTPD